MTEEQYGLLLTGFALFAAFGAILNLLRLKSRGTSAILLSLSFLLAGLLALMIKAKIDATYLNLVGVLIGAALIGDLFLRSKNQERRP